MDGKLYHSLLVRWGFFPPFTPLDYTDYYKLQDFVVTIIACTEKKGDNKQTNTVNINIPRIRSVKVLCKRSQRYRYDTVSGVVTIIYRYGYR